LIDLDDHWQIGLLAGDRPANLCRLRCSLGWLMILDVSRRKKQQALSVVPAPETVIFLKTSAPNTLSFADCPASQGMGSELQSTAVRFRVIPTRYVTAPAGADCRGSGPPRRPDDGA